MEAYMSTPCPKCGTQDYGTPYCVKCQAPMDRSRPPGKVLTLEPVDMESASLASVPRRFLALIGDYLIIGIIADLVSMAYRLGTGSSSASMGFYVGFWFSTLLFLAYFTLFIGELGQTPGKKLFGLRVVRTDGLPVSYGQAFVRAIGYFISLFMWLGFLWALWDRRNQTWHDKLAGTLVIQSPKSKV